ncbi:MAG: capsid protein [Circoviridae sp.]|nr:MAG: capsid protein [Circoviridae sp.]
MGKGYDPTSYLLGGLAALGIGASSQRGLVAFKGTNSTNTTRVGSTVGYKSSYKSRKRTRVSGKRTNTKRVYKKSRKSRPKSALKTLQKQVRTLQKEQEVDMGTLIYRQRSIRQTTSAQLGALYDYFAMSDKTFNELLCTKLRIIDPSNPGTFLTPNLQNVDAFSIYVKSAYAKISCRNNYQVPVVLDLYAVRVKNDNGYSPKSAVEQGITNIGGGALSQTSPLVFPSDSNVFRDLWKIDMHKKIKLEAGQTAEMSFNIGSYDYDPSFADSHQDDYQVSFKSCAFFWRVSGVHGHDVNDITKVGLLQSGVDCLIDMKYVVRYAAGGDVEFLEVLDESDLTATPTDGVDVIANKAVSDNQVYAVA